MPQQQSGIPSEDSLSFFSSVFGALGSTLSQQQDARTLLLGLVLASFSKALPSLADPSIRATDKWEDLWLFLAAFLGTLGAGIQTNLTFSNQNVLIYALFLGLLGKTIPSLIKFRHENAVDHLGDLLPVLIAVSTFIASIPLGTQYAVVGVFFGFLAKQLSPSPQPGTGSQPAQGGSPAEVG